MQHRPWTSAIPKFDLRPSLSGPARQFTRVVVIVLLTLMANGLLSLSTLAGSARLIEVRSAGQVYTGRVIAMNGPTCFLQDRFGVLERLTVSELSGFRVVAEHFRSASASEFQARLRSEFSGGYETAGSTHYLVCAPQGRAAAYCEKFEAVYREIERFYRLHGFTVHSPETVLTAVVFGSQAEFREYCRADEVTWSVELQGYYSLRSNRIALYDESPGSMLTATRRLYRPLLNGRNSSDQMPSALSDARPMFLVSPDTAKTIIHETTHQTGYNIGIHSRLGGSPAWILEGLATVLEADGVRQSGSKGAQKSRMNQSRLDWFCNQYAARRQPGDLARMVADEQYFQRNPLDAYCLAWAFTYYMADSPPRTRQFVQYLRHVESRDPQAAYSAEERIADFTRILGDISRVEVDFIRFMDRL